MDNANELITTRFCIPYELTGFYLAIPFLAAMITSFLGDYVLSRVARPNLIFYVSALPLLGHAIIFLDENCSEEPTVFG